MTKISHPTVETITAEISVVKIGNKQMTISVFKQLYEEECWDASYNMIYPVWGKTNREEEYVIFQKDTELRKCIIPSIIPYALNFAEEIVRYIHANATRIRESYCKEHFNDTPEHFLWVLSYSKSEYSYGRERTWNIVKEHGEEYIEKAFSVFPQDIQLKFKEQFLKEVWLKEKFEKMVAELNNSKQLFIAI